MSDIMLDVIRRWLTNSVSTSTGSGPPGEVFSAYESLVNERNAAKARVAELEAALPDIKQMTSKAASFTRYAYAVHEFDGPNHWHDLSEINALCGPKEGKP